MASVHFVKKARKANKEAGIKKGESYYWWSFKFGGKRYSKTLPRASQLTQSDFLSQAYSLSEQLEDITVDMDIDEIRSQVEDVVEQIRSLGEEQAEKYDNMPEGLQSGSTGELLQGRVDECEDWASNLESVDFGDITNKDTEVKLDLIEELNSCGYKGE